MKGHNMTRKDFQLIADTLKANKPDEYWTAETDQWKSTVLEFTINLATTNARFDREGFKAACGLEVKQ